MYVCSICVHGALRDQRRALNSLELVLHMVLSCQVGWESTLSLLQKQQVFFTTELSLQPQTDILKSILVEEYGAMFTSSYLCVEVCMCVLYLGRLRNLTGAVCIGAYC